ncbi:receptor-type tyrosine-protein phosphatase kappa-like isoform X1 [Haliotis rufescens]|uniref:receptor-type tyrosine-protein phosphatase kappa-like isoform X1 n=1 Tax=Haliotis rufescens TaxID=6454 RepID=UPI00201F33A5|nr:receptor-type tyrosine-protein phosphatase kappa-like isoform X1 [Haliotis rufescens]
MSHVLCVAIVVVVGVLSAQAQIKRCSDSSSGCSSSQYCLDRNDGTGVLCVGCSPACTGCSGPNDDNCLACARGYLRQGSICRRCPSYLFGVNCTGTCHCLNQELCRTDGFCAGWKCARGWKEPPFCQDGCDNNTFGLDCALSCNCVGDESCDSVNGLCRDGLCHPDYGGPSCQIRLPKLVSPPSAASVGCQRANITWPSWNEEIDIGEGPIADYRLYRKLNNSVTWEFVTTRMSEAGRTGYYHYMLDLQRDRNYRFRVDIQRDDGGKAMTASEGFPSPLVYILCTPTTEPPPTTTTTRSIIGLKVFDVVTPVLLSDGTVRMSWTLTGNATSLSIAFNITLFYKEVGIGDCAVVDGPITRVPVTHTSGSGSVNITDLDPWRVYSFTLEAFGEALNISDVLDRRISTREIAPNDTVSNFATRDLTSRTVMITWASVPCAQRGGRFVQYNIMLNSSSSLRNDVSNVTSINYDSLTPYTQYNVTVTYQNTVAIGPMSAAFTFTTEEEAPGPMFISGRTVTESTILVTFTPPSTTNGVLTEYGLTYSDNATFSTQKTLTFPAPQTAVTIDSLRAFTTYYFRMRARTKAGWGPYTADSTVTTAPNTPHAPLSLASTYQNETCLTVAWQPPLLSNGLLQSYRIRFQKASDDDTPTVDVVDAITTSYTTCRLQPGVMYLFFVAVRNTVGFSQEVSGSFWTEHGDPRTPPPPVFINATYSTMSVYIEPVLPTSGPITKYQLRVEKVGSRRRRQAAGYITAELEPSQVPQRRQFEIGDGRNYSGVVNRPLEREKYYNIYYVVVSTLNSVTKTSYSQMKGPRLTAPVYLTTVSPPPAAADNTGLIVGIILALILLILIILAILLFLWWRRRNRLPAYKPYVDKGYDMPVVKDDYDPLKYWNTIYSVRESRYIVAGREYLPDDMVTMNGEVTIPPEGEPVTFKNEFKSLSHDFGDPSHVAKDRRNKHKNRFPHLLPYDKSRVALFQDENSTNDYINASYVSGFKKPMAYIAAQSPFDEDSVLDFWRLISQTKVRTIVMITNIVEDNIVKCTQYWPENGRASYGSFLLELLDIEYFASYVVRVVAYQTSEGLKGSVKIFEFTAWPEHGVPFDPIPILEMRHKVRRAHMNVKTPILVHCGTGMGRTGTYIAIDALIEQYSKEGRTSVRAFINKIRKDRPFMVRTLKEYVFIYEALFEQFHAGHTVVGFDLKEWYSQLTMRNKKTGHSYLKGQFRLLEKFTRSPRPEQCHTAILPVNYNKNRYPDVIPMESFRPVLMTAGGIGRTDYINATFLDGFRLKNEFILTQTPLPSTIVDFWKLVYDYDVNTVVMVETFKHEDDTCAEYWPDVTMKPFEPFFVETTATYQENNVTIRNFKIHNSNQPKEAPKFVRQFQFNGWDEPNVIPTSKTLILDLLDLVTDWQQVTNENTKPMIVHCRDGATHSGLFCAIKVICEKIAEDEEVDVLHTVKHMKRRRAQILAYPEQLRFCYKTLWDYINLRLPDSGFTDTYGTSLDQYNAVPSLSLTSFYDTLYSN